MPRRPASLRARLVGMIALLFLLGMVAMYAGARHYSAFGADRSYDRLLSGSALSIAETLSVARGDVLVDIPYAALDMLSAAPDDRVFYRIYGPDDGTVTGYHDLPESPQASAAIRKSLNGAPAFFDADYRGETVRFVLIGRQVSQPAAQGWVWVQVGHTRRARSELAQEMVLQALLPIVVLTGMALLVVWFGITRALRPLQRIGDDIRARAPSDLQPIDAPMPKEIEPLVGALNLFMKRLGGNIETLRAFIAEAAHQMRTPLAALRVQAQDALESDDPADRQHGLSAVVRNAEKLSRLLNQLLSDATVIHRSEMRRFEAFDLLQAVRRAVRDTVPVGREGQVSVASELDEAPYFGDGLILCEAIMNLIDNAIRHGDGQQRPVDIQLSHRDGSYVLRIADRGPGIPDDRRDAVFERFVRGVNGGTGVGLGLAIVRQAIESNGGSIALLDREGGGLLVEVRLPWRMK